jgi:hypothetical protein
MSRIHPLSSLLVLASLAGCAASVPNRQRSETSAAAIRAAEEVGAAKVARASLYLQLAKEEAAKATALEAAGEPERAASLMLRAEADANLAVLVARADGEQAKAAAAAERLRQLKQAN